MSSHDSEDSDIHAFIDQLKLEELCRIASDIEGGGSCSLGGHTVGGFNIIQELVFQDGKVWLARIPRPDNCFEPEEATLSYAAVLRYLKKHSSIPVPSVYDYAAASDSGNTFGTSYILMEKLPGHDLPTFDDDSDDDSDDDDLAPVQLSAARKIHEQLTDIIIELASHRFESIGSLREDPEGNFTVVQYCDPTYTSQPEERTTAFHSLDPHYRGPYRSITDFYSSISVLNLTQETTGPGHKHSPQMIADYKALARLAPKIIIPEFDNGPFVIGHNDLTVQNILVDDEFNITGIIDFPGNTVPLPSLCVFPWMFHDNLSGPVVARDAYKEVFISKHSDNGSSALQSTSVRRQLIESAITRNQFELALLGPMISLVLPDLYESINGEKYVQQGTGDGATA